MARLGYQRYGVQGGDWGSIIGTQVALNDAPHVAGLHLNMCTAAAPAGGDPNAGLSDAEKERLKVRQAFQAEETGYQQIQGTKPQTIGIALNDSPVGLAAWIVEKFRTLVRLRRQPGDDLHEGRTADQHHAVLGDADGGLVGAHLLREPPCRAGAGRTAAHRDADGLRRLSQGDHLVAAAVARGALQHHALDGDAARRSLRRVRAAGSAGRRRARVLPHGAIGNLQRPFAAVLAVSAVKQRLQPQEAADAVDQGMRRFDAGRLHGPGGAMLFELEPPLRDRGGHLLENRGVGERPPAGTRRRRSRSARSR